MYEDKTVFKVDKVRVSPPDPDPDVDALAPHDWILMDVSPPDTMSSVQQTNNQDHFAVPYSLDAYQALAPKPTYKSIWFVEFQQGVTHIENNVSYKVVKSYIMFEIKAQQLP